MRNYRKLLIMAVLLAVFPGIAAAVSDEGRLLGIVASARTGFSRARAYADLARWYAAQQENDKAIDAYRKALSEKPRRKDAYALYLETGDLLLKGKQYAHAIEDYQESVMLFPRQEAAHLRLARVYEQSDLHELACQEYLGILKYNRRSYEANFGLASLYLAQGLNGPAMEYYRQALLLRPAAEVYRCMACGAERAGDMQLAVAMFTQIIPSERCYDDDISLGRLYEGLKNYKESEEAYSQAIKLNPEKAEGYVFLSLLYQRSDNLMPAEKLLQVAQLKAPNEGLTHFFSGAIYYRKADYQAARREIGIAFELAKSETLRAYCRKFIRFMDTLPASR